MWTAAVLVGLAAAAMVCRWAFSAKPEPAGVRDFYRLRYDIAVRTATQGAKVHVSLPDNTYTCRVRREVFSHSGMPMDIVRNPRTDGRSVVLLTSDTNGEGKFSAEFDVQILRSPPSSRAAQAPLSKEDRRYYLRPEQNIQVGGPSANRVLADLGGTQVGTDQLLQAIFLYCWQEIEGQESPGTSSAATTLDTGAGTDLGRARAMIALCRSASIPARLVTGFRLAQQQDLCPHVWLEAYHDGGWVSFDPEAGYARHLPAYYLPVRADGPELVRTPTGQSVLSGFSCELLDEDAVGLPPTHGSAGNVADLTRLPPGMRQTLAVLLLLPLGALITAAFRNMVGLQTFGTFTPALLALSFVFSDLVTGLVVFVLVIAVGLAIRAGLDRLKLMLVPRLGIVLTAVVILLATAVSVLDFLGLTPSARAVIFPLVIMTMMVERFYICREEDGSPTAYRLLGGTLAVAACCLLVLRWRWLGEVVLRWPELELAVAAGLLFLGRYSGYRLMELFRFRDFAAGQEGSHRV